MAQLLIRNLDDSVVEALKRRAAMNGRSLAEEVRRTLTAATISDRESFLARIDALRAARGRISGPTSLEDLRALRDGTAL